MHVESERWHENREMIYLSLLCTSVKVKAVLVWWYCMVKSVLEGTCGHALKLPLYIPCSGWRWDHHAVTRASTVGGGCVMAGCNLGALQVGQDHSHPGKEEQSGPGTTGQWRQGEKLARRRL